MFRPKKSYTKTLQELSILRPKPSAIFEFSGSMKSMKKNIIAFLALFVLSSSFTFQAMAVSDKDIDAKVKKSKNGVFLYVWSHQMPYSQIGLKNAKAAALKQKLDFLPVNDIYDINAKEKDKLMSVKIWSQNQIQHFPAAFILKKDQTYGPFMGLKSKDSYSSWFQEQKNRDIASMDVLPTKDNFKVIDDSNLWQVTDYITPKKQPRYFFRPDYFGRYIPYTNVTSNNIINVKTKEEAVVSGLVDAVPTPDGIFLTVPYDYLLIFSHLNFFEFDKLNFGEGSSRPARVLRDSSLSGAYQTIAQLGELKYRIVTESSFKKGRLRMQDYQATKEQNGEYKVLPINKESKVFCPEQNLTMPVISKKGHLFSAVDADTRETIIYDLDKEGNCKINHRTGFVAAKGDFSEDEKFLFFHRSTVNEKETARILKRPNVKLDIEVYQYELVTRKMTKITDCNAQGFNCYYPNILQDGTIDILVQNKSTNKSIFGKLTRKPSNPVSK